MSLLDDHQFQESYKLFLKFGWPHLSSMLDCLAPHATAMDPLTRTMLFNGFGKYMMRASDLALNPELTIAEAHAQAVAEVMQDPAVDHVVQNQLKSMLDQGVKQFQEDNQ